MNTAERIKFLSDTNWKLVWYREDGPIEEWQRADEVLEYIRKLENETRSK